MKLSAWTLLLRPFHYLVSGRGSKPRLPILIYHRVLPKPDPLQPGEVDADTFDWHMSLMARHFRLLPLKEAILHMRAGTLPNRSACITFDDGYADNAETALPILKKHGVPATFFIATNYIDGGIMWNDIVIESIRQFSGDILDLVFLGLGKFKLSSNESRFNAITEILPKIKYLPIRQRQAVVEKIAELANVDLPPSLMMTSEQLKRLHSSGMEIGGHTQSHPILAKTDADDAYREIKEGKVWLENLLNINVVTFAYPNGKPNTDYLQDHVAMVKDLGFLSAVSTVTGGASDRSDFWQLPRFTPWDKTPLRFMLRLLRVCY